MYAIIRAGGRQYKVAKGDVIEINRLKDASETVEFEPLLIMQDDGAANLDKTDLAKARVTGTVLGESKGKKIEIFKYRNKTGYRRRAGHRQSYTRVQIDDIRVGARSGRTKKQEAATDGS